MATGSFKVHEIPTFYNKNSISGLNNAVESLFAELPSGAINVTMSTGSYFFYCCGYKASATVGTLTTFGYGTSPLRVHTDEAGTWTHKIVTVS